MRRNTICILSQIRTIQLSVNSADNTECSSYANS